MDFYRLKKPGSEWFTRQGDAIKAAKADKVEWEKIEVPTSKKEEMQAWLNTNVRDAAAPQMIVPSDIEADSEPGPTVHRKEEACPKCKWTPKMCEGYVRQKLQSMTVEALKEWIETREGWELASIIESITYRLSLLAKQAVGKKA